MKKLSHLTIVLLLLGSTLLAQNTTTPTRTIFAYGGALQKAFIKEVITLTGKPKPKICFLPTASADNPYAIIQFLTLCRELSVEPYYLGVWVNASPEQQTFEERLMSMDAIIVGGGNTLNMIAIWRAQGIDTVLQKAYRNGTVLAGGSAGSLCWFTGGYSDSRPKNMTIVNGLGILPYSHCPHYHSEPTRKPLYVSALLDGKMGPGYACDDKAGILFQNERYTKAFSLDSDDHCYFLSVKSGKIDEELLPTEIIE
ncbi:peptidase E [Puia dinghuensis]|uniref:Putative peptidase YgaJ n=1 Tax=Puia dinghuensis TaxID=1792502 RepID=A0A8J2XVF2_9BACT|nr:peptidase E [Puia dinghuensis]GGB18043.1 putative peptidase YgaJ [Puia dinghuensis]